MDEFVTRFDALTVDANILRVLLTGFIVLMEAVFLLVAMRFTRAKKVTHPSEVFS